MIALRHSAWPRYANDRSNHIFTQHQLLILLVLRQRLSKSYREFVSWLKVMDGILRELALEYVPHFSTLQKFSSRVDMRLLEGLMATIAKRHAHGDLTVAVDSTGFSCGYASRYFIHVLSVRLCDGGQIHDRPVRRYVKQSTVIDTSTQMILAMELRYGPGNDFPDAIPVLAKTASKFIVGTVLADKGYDSEDIRRFIKYKMKARIQIPTRKPKKASGPVHGKLRRQQASNYDAYVYHQRSLVETMHSVSKRVMGEGVRARIQRCQWNELAIRGISYNAWRAAALHID